MTTQTTPAFRYAAVTFDCADPQELAAFYGELLGHPVLFSTDDFVLLGKEGAAGLGFTRIAGYRPPTWPDPARAKQAHIELGVDDLAEAEQRLLELGAVKPEFQPGEGRWTVLLDPAGHPFCITTLA
ncbi:VOC family protein [Streptomyces misionensis]|uniref:VOC family protein n=1 Tax=Streptomyces misionensis TaxID=67331 RepID=A0A5C6JGK1_9ACTN|nr:VOC family protein [Streptomyces misionensis]TWV40309.1 VOC family protein [Streptomyces misionensis]